MITEDEKEELKEAAEELLGAFEAFNNLLRRADKHIYTRWKAGGKAVSDEFVSMYPSVNGVLDEIDNLEVEAEEEED